MTTKPPDPTLKHAVSEALDHAIARAYDFDGPTPEDIGLVLVQLTTRWARGVLTPAQILETVHAVLSEPAPVLRVTEMAIPGRTPLPNWCLGVIQGGWFSAPISDSVPPKLLDALQRAAIDTALAAFVTATTRHQGERFRLAVLYGSQARGDAGANSDVDVAVILAGTGDRLETKLALADLAYDVLLDTGVLISPMPVWEAEWADPERHPNPQLVRNIQQDGKLVAGRE